MNLSTTIKSIQDTMRKDDGIEIDQFYQQLGKEIHKDWIKQGEVTVNIGQLGDNT